MPLSHAYSLSIPSLPVLAMRQVTLSFIGEAPRSKLTLQPRPNLPSSSCVFSASPQGGHQLTHLLDGILLTVN